MNHEFSVSVRRTPLLALIRRRGGSVSCRDLTHGCGRRFRNAHECKLALQQLVDRGFGEWWHRPIGPRGGRPRMMFSINGFNIFNYRDDAGLLEALYDAARACRAMQPFTDEVVEMLEHHLQVGVEKIGPTEAACVLETFAQRLRALASRRELPTS
jgi:hypothetical protein